MFSRRERALIGVPTGAVAGFDVLDINPKNGGLDWHDSVKADLPFTRVHHTRSGGLHLLFRHLDGMRCSSSKIAPGVDVRAEAATLYGGPRQGWSSRTIRQAA